MYAPSSWFLLAFSFGIGEMPSYCSRRIPVSLLSSAIASDKFSTRVVSKSYSFLGVKSFLFLRSFGTSLTELSALLYQLCFEPLSLLGLEVPGQIVAFGFAGTRCFSVRPSMGDRYYTDPIGVCSIWSKRR